MTDHCVITVDAGYCDIVPVRVDAGSPLAYSVRVYGYSADGLGDHLLSMATAERESDARLIAQTLVHAHLCADCERGVEH